MNPGDAVKVRGWSGVAFRVLGPVLDTEGNAYDIESNGDGSVLRVCMVGDDKVHEVDATDCTLLQDTEFCDGCGQIGCGHGSVRDE